MPDLVCKECVEGKHGACNGDTFDEDADEFTGCRCANKTHEDRNGRGPGDEEENQ